MTYSPPCCHDCKKLPCHGEYCTAEREGDRCEWQLIDCACPADSCERFKRCKAEDRE